jgi:hypothetical protein
MNVLKVELVVIDDKLENGTCGVLGKVGENDGLCLIEAHLQEPAEHVGTQQHFYKINKRRLVFVFERVDDHTIIFGDDDVMKGIEQNGNEEINKKNKGILFHE